MSRLASVLLAVCLMAAPVIGAAMPSPLFAQADDAADGETNSETTEAESPSTRVSPPARSFVLDYLIVGGLVAVALYAVCRSGRRH